jgi:rhodanese-related sulfurtransferase
MSEGFEKLGFKIGSIQHFSPKEAYEAAKKGAVLVDVRQTYETHYKGFDVEEVIYIDHEEIKDKYKELPQEKFLVIADSVGLHSKEVLEFLQEKGFKLLANLNGGIFDWERDGLPLKRNKKEKLTGSCACMLKPHGKRIKN